MAQEDSNEKKERRYEESQDDTRIIRREIEKAIRANGEVLNALKGDGLGNPGMVKRLETLETNFSELKDTMDEVLLKTNKKANQLAIIMIMAGTFFGIFIHWLTEQFTHATK